MSCKKEGCCNNKLPRAEMVAIPDWVINQLLAVAHTGLKNFPWPSDTVRVLAERIAALVVENEMLRKLLNGNTKPELVVSDDALAFTFGPDKSYTLHVPVADQKAREELANSLVDAVIALNAHKVKHASSQLNLVFPE